MRTRSTLRGDNAVTQWIAGDEGGRPHISKPLHDICAIGEAHGARVVSVIGVARSGKSTLLNIWGNALKAEGGIGEAGRKRWCGTSDGVDSFTRGAHAAPWCYYGGEDEQKHAVAFVDCEGQGHEGKAVDGGFFIPLYLMSRVVVWNVPSLAKDDNLQALDNIIAMTQHMNVGIDEEADDEEYERASARSQGIFGHLVVVVRNSELQGDAMAELMGLEEVKYRRGQLVQTDKNLARAKRNGIRERINHWFSSIQVQQLPPPRQAEDPDRDPRFRAAAERLLGLVTQVAVQDFEPCELCLQQPLEDLAAPAAAPRRQTRRSSRARRSAGAPAAGGGGRRPTARSGPFTFRDLHATTSHVVDQIRETGVVAPAGIRDTLRREAEHRQQMEEEEKQRKAAELKALQEAEAAAAARAAAATDRKQRIAAVKEQRAVEERMEELLKQQAKRDEEHKAEVQKFRDEVAQMQRQAEQMADQARQMQQMQAMMGAMGAMGGGGGGMNGGGIGGPPMGGRGRPSVGSIHHPRCLDGSLDMRFTVNKGLSKFG